MIDQDIINGTSKKKTWAQRTFGPMNPGSLRGTVLMLMAGAMGSGLLALPSNAQ
jgi:hypothetical protein